MNKGFFLPQKPAEKIIGATNMAIREKSLNIGLFLDKYVVWWRERNELKCNYNVQVSILRKIQNSPNHIKKILVDPRVDGRKFKDKILKDERLSIPQSILPLQYYESYRKRMESLLKSLEQMRLHVKSEKLPLLWRLAINLGASSVYETSLLFHRNYSVPYIPGSAVKGITRHWAVQKFAEKFKELQKTSFEDAVRKVDDALENGRDLRMELDGIKFKELIDIFGTQREKGKVIFFDALPIIEGNRDFIVLDVMNVHYGDYYQDESGKTPPGDWMNPTPIFFLAVEKGTKFRFSLASKYENLARISMKLLKEALKNFGIGAKTSAGYGYFAEV